MESLKKITVIGLGLLGASVSLAAQRSFKSLKTSGYSHRKVTRDKALNLGVVQSVSDKIEESVVDSDLIILASPIGTFEDVFKSISPALKDGAIVTDVGSTKVLPYRWAKECLPDNVFYVGSHPIAGSEKRGVEFARDDLLEGANCIVTVEKDTNKKAAETVKAFWKGLGSIIYTMGVDRHDKMLAAVSHLPHLMAAALVNSTDFEDLKMAGKGLLDTSRIASGPANIWTDIFMANSENAVGNIDRAIKELNKLKKAIGDKDSDKIYDLLEDARKQREKLVNYKMKKGEIL